MVTYHGEGNREWCLIKNGAFISATNDYQAAMKWFEAHSEEGDSYEVKLVTTIATYNKGVIR